MDTITERLVVVDSRASVVRLSPSLADLLARPLAGGRRLMLVTPETSRLTIGLRTALVAAGGTWAVLSGRGYRDGLTGLEFERLDEVGAAGGTGMQASAPAHGVSPDGPGQGERPVAGFGGVAAPEALVLPQPDEGFTTQLSVDVTVLHAADDAQGGFLGEALSAMARAVADGEPVSWGMTEPLEHGWDRWAMTQDARHRAPDTARYVVEGPQLSASVTTRPTDDGVEETIALTIDVPGGNAGLDPAIERLALALADLTRTSLPTFALVLARWGDRDRSFRPVTYPPPNPVALLIGAPSVAMLDLHQAAFAPEQAVLVVGRPLEPAFLLPLGSARSSGWEALHDALDSVGTARLTTLIEPPLLQVWDDDLQGDLDHDGEPHPHDDRGVTGAS